MLILACHYQTPSKPVEKANAPYRNWFTDSYDAVSEHKYNVLTRRGYWNPPIQEFFKLLDIWLRLICLALRDGIVALGSKEMERERALLTEQPLSNVSLADEANLKETFDGLFSYDVMFGVMRTFNKANLIIKNPEHM
ncbi:hypothetical protein GYMLUDRAFT_240441 [Collybiopsis luxurians FD-317 M1]|nr:hypothetical protein GYMLUDRAFT_240441 [Collybiopsis luxurians FD-317 M1]